MLLQCNCEQAGAQASSLIWAIANLGIAVAAWPELPTNARARTGTCTHWLWHEHTHAHAHEHARAHPRTHGRPDAQARTVLASPAMAAKQSEIAHSVPCTERSECLGALTRG